MNGYLFTLNAKTGKLTTTFGDNGRVNLKAGVADKFPRWRYGVSSPPAIYKAVRGDSGWRRRDARRGESGRTAICFRVALV